MLRWLPICFLLCVLSVQGQQNLIQNGSFEEYDPCPAHFEIFAPKYWYNTSINTPNNYSSICFSDSTSGVPYNAPGFQYPQDGNAYAGAGVYAFSSNQREMITNKLSQPLDSNNTYCLTFYVNAADNDSWRTYIDKIGIYFSTDSIHFNTYYLLPVTPQLYTPDGLFFSDTINWTKVDVSYIASGGERYMTVGNFNSDADTDTIFGGDNIAQAMGYLFYDNFSLVECNPPPPPTEIIIPNVFTPNGDQLNETFDIENLPDNSSLIIYNRWGNVVYQSDNYQNNWKGENNSSAVYYYILTLPNGQIKKGTITLLK
jgi:gliding motility-associated-like protein